MGYSISQETYERLERNRTQGRLCQGSGRCSTRGNRIVVALLEQSDGWSWSTFVVCKKHADEMIAWPAFVNGAMWLWTMIERNASAAQIEQEARSYREQIITPAQIAEVQHRMRVDEAKRAAWEAARRT